MYILYYYTTLIAFVIYVFVSEHNTLQCARSIQLLVNLMDCYKFSVHAVAQVHIAVIIPYLLSIIALAVPTYPLGFSSHTFRYGAA